MTLSHAPAGAGAQVVRALRGRRAQALVAVISVGVLCLFAACASGIAQSKPAKLREAVTQYNRHIRWGNTGAAAAYLTPDQRQAFTDARAEAEGELVILSVDVGAVDADYDTGIAKVDVRYEWREENGITVNTTRVRQLWRYDADTWLLHSKAEVKAKPKKSARSKSLPTADDKKTPKIEDRF